MDSHVHREGRYFYDADCANFDQKICDLKNYSRGVRRFLIALRGNRIDDGDWASFNLLYGLTDGDLSGVDLAPRTRGESASANSSHIEWIEGYTMAGGYGVYLTNCLMQENDVFYFNSTKSCQTTSSQL